MSEMTHVKSWRELLCPGSFVEGKFVTGEQTFPVTDPATGETLAEIADADDNTIERTIEAARKAFGTWRDRTSAERAAFLWRWHSEIVANADALSELLTREQGKPLEEAKGEIAYAAGFVSWFAEEARRAYGETIPADRPGREYLVVQEPVGVAAAITPWNFPAAMITRKVAPAVAAGCTSIVKPAAETPLTALALAALADRAGAPAGLINVITGTDAAGIGRVLCSDPRIRKLSFTGSTNVGRLLAEQCSGTLKRLSLELGGNAPFIVFADADLDLAADALMASKFRNSGQTCVCANRIYVEGPVANAFAGKVQDRMRALKLGHGLEKGVTQGPLISDRAKVRVEHLINDAQRKGAHCFRAHDAALPGDRFMEPVYLSGVTQDMEISGEEIFGPVVAAFRFETEADVVEMANSTEFGLASYVFTSSVSRAWRMVRAIESGMVAVNEGVMSTPVGPFGGVKQSGFGREGAKQGLSEYLEPKFVCFGGLH